MRLMQIARGLARRNATRCVPLLLTQLLRETPTAATADAAPSASAAPEAGRDLGAGRGWRVPVLCELLACCVEALTPAGPLTMATVLDQPAVWCGLCSWHVAFDAAKPTGAAKPPGSAASYADSCAALAAAAATVGAAVGV